MRSAEPLDLLALVSGLLEITDPRRADPFAAEDAEPGPNLRDLVDSFVETPVPETTAVLAAIRAFTSDELLAARIGRELAARRDRLPEWLEELSEATPEPDVWHLTEVLGDGDDYLYGVVLPTGEELSALVYVDHNLGGAVKDAFITPLPVATLAATIRDQTAAEPDQTLLPVDPAAARAAIELAIERGAITYPPLESDSWPMCRPMVEWMLRMLPPGGQVPARPAWTEPQLDALQAGFFASSHGSLLDDADHRTLLGSVLWYASDYGPGDPLRWSEVKLEILLLDWFPRKVIADRAYLGLLPELLAAFIPYAHEQSGVRDALTETALAALRSMTPDYLSRIGSAPESLADQLAALLGGSGDADISELLDQLGLDIDAEPQSWEQMMLASLEAAVGGAEQLRNLDADPLPDEPFAWDGIAEDIRPVVTAMLEFCDRCADALLDVEHRTAMRRFLARAAVADPAVFRRRATPNRGAAAVAWVICRANGTAGTYRSGELTSGQLMAFFGVKGSASQRAEPLLKAIGVQPYGFSYDPQLGTPDLLVSSCRADLIEQRRRSG